MRAGGARCIDAVEQDSSPIVREYGEEEKKSDFKHKTDCVKAIYGVCHNFVPFACRRVKRIKHQFSRRF